MRSALCAPARAVALATPRGWVELAAAAHPRRVLPTSIYSLLSIARSAGRRRAPRCGSFGAGARARARGGIGTSGRTARAIVARRSGGRAAARGARRPALVEILVLEGGLLPRRVGARRAVFGGPRVVAHLCAGAWLRVPRDVDAAERARDVAASAALPRAALARRPRARVGPRAGGARARPARRGRAGSPRGPRRCSRRRATGRAARARGGARPRRRRRRGRTRAGGTARPRPRRARRAPPPTAPPRRGRGAARRRHEPQPAARRRRELARDDRVDVLERRAACRRAPPRDVLPVDRQVGGPPSAAPGRAAHTARASCASLRRWRPSYLADRASQPCAASCRARRSSEPTARQPNSAATGGGDIEAAQVCDVHGVGVDALHEDRADRRIARRGSATSARDLAQALGERDVVGSRAGVGASSSSAAGAGGASSRATAIASARAR